MKSDLGVADDLQTVINDALKDKNVKYCFDRLGDNKIDVGTCIMTVAKNLSNPRICNQFWSVETMSECLFEVAKIQENAQPCERIPFDSPYKSKCKSYLKNIAVDKMKVVMCKKLMGEDKNDCLIRIGEKRKSARICTKHFKKGTEIHTTCLSRVKEAKESEKQLENT